MEEEEKEEFCEDRSASGRGTTETNRPVLRDMKTRRRSLQQMTIKGLSETGRHWLKTGTGYLVGCQRAGGL